MQSSPDSVRQLQVQQLANKPRHVVDGHSPSVDPSGQRCPRPTNDFDLTQGTDLDGRIQALSCHLNQCTKEIESLICWIWWLRRTNANHQHSTPRTETKLFSVIKNGDAFRWGENVMDFNALVIISRHYYNKLAVTL